jgi:hypothetical protein
MRRVGEVRIAFAAVRPQSAPCLVSGGGPLCRLRLMLWRHPQSYSRFLSLRYRSIQAAAARNVKEILTKEIC